MKNPAETFAIYRLKYKPLYEFNRDMHLDIVRSGKSTHGHGQDHDLTVAQYGALIAPDEHDGELAWVAGLLHSMDRHFLETEAHDKIERGLDLAFKCGLSTEDIEQVRVAVAHHSKMNDDADGPVTIILKDADRLANLGAINIIRGGQHRPDIPACIPETLGRLHPESTFKNPKSCYDATFYNSEWEAMLRLPKAKELGARYFRFIEEWRALAVSQAAEVGLYPWPEHIAG